MLLLQIPPDGGPIYAETDLTSFVAEPWNAISSLAIMFPPIYWAIRLKWQFKRYSFLYTVIPLLTLGGLGSTLYHAFRATKWFLFMDGGPTAIAMILICVYLWGKIIENKLYVFLIVATFLAIRIGGHVFLEDKTLAINFGYFVTGVFIFLPVFTYLRQNEFYQWKLIVISGVALALSLLFRGIDFETTSIFPMGSHFLWHIFSGIGAFYLAKFLFLIRNKELGISAN